MPSGTYSGNPRKRNKKKINERRKKLRDNFKGNSFIRRGISFKEIRGKRVEK